MCTYIIIYNNLYPIINKIDNLYTYMLLYSESSNLVHAYMSIINLKAMNTTFIMFCDKRI